MLYNRLLNNQYQKYWFVNFSPADENHHHNVSYLGRYLKRPALANSRLRHYDGRSVIFNYYDHKEKKHKNYECFVSVATSVGIFAHPMMQNRRAKRDDYKPSAVRVTQRCVP
ncbi:hypothetical protein X973_15180 [Piscirickettsia salmonis]|nr:hypothetical protein X973_15180 [Piscirickettsia salmonis]